jgi:IS30 family transposase
MSHKYFTINERNKLEVLLKENYRVVQLSNICYKNRKKIINFSSF